MKQKQSFFISVCRLAIPVAMQSMLQASFSIVDQIMIGQLGSVSVAGVGLAGKFTSIYSVVVSAIGAVAGIMIAQYLGQKNRQEVRRSFYLNFIMALGLAVFFTFLCIVFPKQIMGLYIDDPNTQEVSAKYLAIIAGTFLPMAGATLISTLFRCIEKAHLPLFASIASAFVNTGLNYCLIFGKFGLPAMGAEGAGIATLISQVVNFALMLIMMTKYGSILKKPKDCRERMPKFNWKQYMAMLLPILVCETLWSLGENVYAAIYGHMGTSASAAMTLINPIQGLLIGALCGLSQAAGVIIGKKLGEEKYDDAYKASKKLILYGMVGSILLSILVVVTRNRYVEIYKVEDSVKLLTGQILVAYALVAPFKVLNMILGGGIIRSGGKTKYVMVIDMIGTWGFGVPLGLLSAFVFNLSIPYVYFILSLEECIRFAISVLVFRRKKWMQCLESTPSTLTNK
ncbi:MAG: MATE family efflux transporter [Butyrivibrio sp.]